MGGASRTIGRLGVEVALIAEAASARVSIGVRVSIISLSALVAVNDAPVALENLREREKISRSSGRRDKRAHAITHLFVRHTGTARVSRGLVLELRGRWRFGRGGACDRGRGGATTRTAGVARLRMIHCR